MIRLVASVLVVIFLASCASAAPTPTVGPTLTPIDLTINLNANPYGYDPAEIQLVAGQPYRLKLIADEELHTFTIRELDINFPVPSEATVRRTLIIDQPRTYQLICIPYENQGMVGTVTVVAP